MLLPLVLLAQAALEIRVEVEPLGKGTDGTVVAVAVQLAPEEREQVGPRLRYALELRRQGQTVDRTVGVAEVSPDGSILLYREWPLGEGEVLVDVATVDGQKKGSARRPVSIPALEQPFALPETAPPDAVALLPAPSPEEGVRFLPPKPGTAVGTVHLQLVAPSNAAEVRFFLDGSPLLTKNRPPWDLALSLGPVPKRTLVRAEVLDAQGRWLGEDAIVLNIPGQNLAVQILLGPADTSQPEQTVTVAVSPPGAEEEVVLKLEDRPLARWLACPCAVQVRREELAQAKVLVAEARGAGRQGDAVLVLGGSPWHEEVRVEVVELPVVVLDPQGRAVADLPPEAFRVVEDGEPVRVEAVSRSQEQPLSVGLLVDVSGSMTKDFPLVRQAVTGFLGPFLRPGDRFFLATFAWEFELLVPWASDPRLALERMQAVRVEGGTSLHDAIIKGLELMRGRKGPKGLVLLTDGEDTTSRTGWEAALRVARTMRTPIFPVGVHLSLFDFLLRGKLGQLAATTGGEAFFVGEAEELPEIYRRIGQQLRTHYLLVYRSPSKKPLDQFRAVEVRVNRPELKVRTIAGYFPVP